MKKIYLTPLTSVIHIQASQMIAESLGFKKGTTVTKEEDVMTKDQGSWGDVWGSEDDDE